MKQRHLISLMDKDYTTVSVVFQKDSNRPTTSSTGKRYTYKTLKDNDPQVGDIAIVEVGVQLAFVKIVEVHTTPQIDFDADFDYKWLVQYVEREDYDKRMASEKKFLEGVEAAEKAHQIKLLTSHLPIEAIYKESLT